MLVCLAQDPEKKKKNQGNNTEKGEERCAKSRPFSSTEGTMQATDMYKFTV